MTASSTTSLNPEHGTAAVPRRSSIAIGHECSFPASPTWSRCATSPVWSDQLWDDAIRLRDRYRLVVRAARWDHDIQLEALAALAALVSGYDTGAWNDPVSKLQLLFDLDRIRGLLHAGQDVFDPGRDPRAFEQHLLAIGCQPAPSTVRY